MGFLAALGPLISGVSSLFGVIGNAGLNSAKMNSFNNLVNLGQQTSGTGTNYLNMLMNYAKNPGQAMTGVNALMQPLNQNLINATVGPAQSGLAEAGLAGSPGQMTAAGAQALAPYQMQEQQQALQTFLALLGMPQNAINSLLSYASGAPNYLPQPADTSGLANLGTGIQDIFSKPPGNPTYPGFPANPTIPSFPTTYPGSPTGGGSLNPIPAPQAMSFTGMGSQ